jgi:hypothetical protein
MKIRIDSRSKKPISFKKIINNGVQQGPGTDLRGTLSTSILASEKHLPNFVKMNSLYRLYILQFVLNFTSDSNPDRNFYMFYAKNSIS